MQLKLAIVCPPIALTVALGAAACGPVAVDGDDNAGSDVALGATTQALGMTVSLWRRWPSGVVPYCYQPSHPDQNDPPPGSSEYEARVESAEEAIAIYNALPDSSIDFRGGDLCPDWDDYQVGGDPSTLRIVVTETDGATRSCPRTDISDPNTARSLADGFEAVCEGIPPENEGREVIIAFGSANQHRRLDVMLHEIGHALGFVHEYPRRGGTENDCIDDPSLGGGTGGGDAAITEYDAPSIMNSTGYCHSSARLSPKDIAGLNYVYPVIPAGDKLTVVQFSFPLSNGGVLTGAPTTAPIEFANRVAGVWAFHYDDAAWTKVVSGGTQQVGTGSSVTLANALGSGTSETIRGSFIDQFGRLRSSPNTLIRRDPGLATALVLSTL